MFGRLAESNRAGLLDSEDADEEAPRFKRLNNLLMQLRKAALHPYLFSGVEPVPHVTGEHLVQASGKLMLLDRLLARLKAQGRKVSER